MRKIQNENSGLFQLCLEKSEDYFVLDLTKLAANGYCINLECFGDQLKFSCLTLPPRGLSVSNEDIIVGVPIGTFNSNQLRRLAQIVESLVTLEELKFFRFFDFFISFSSNDPRKKEYFLLDLTKNYDSDENSLIVQAINGKGFDTIELNDSLKPLVHGSIKKKITVMQNLLDHFTKNTNLLIDQIMDKFDEKSISLNKKLETAQNKILLQEAKVNRLNDVAWKIIKQFCEIKELDFSECDTVLSDGVDGGTHIGNGDREVLTLQEALQIRRSHGGEGLPEDFESPDKLLQFGRVEGAPNNIVDEIGPLERDAISRKLKGNIWGPTNTNNVTHMHLRKIDWIQDESMHPAFKQLNKLKANDNSNDIVQINTKLETRSGNKIYDPISEYKVKKSSIADEMAENTKHSPTIFSYLGRPIPKLAHQEIQFIPRKKIIESIQHSMNTESSKNEKWMSYGRPILKREMKLKTPEGIKIEPLNTKVNNFDISSKDVYNILL
ncbi:hypothetical protein OIY81_765 [Cryptosporidium canis]|nr:hypothetical protein OIY81_765 [Cryptosporidium canis]